jgi:hypothetical protein
MTPTLVLFIECMPASDLSPLPVNTALLLPLLLKEEAIEAFCSSAALLLLHLPVMTACSVLFCTESA